MLDNPPPPAFKEPMTASDPPRRAQGSKSIRPSLRPRDLMAETPAPAGLWTIQVITLFPQAFPGVLGLSLTGKALAERRWLLDPIDLRPFGEGRHRNVDDTPAGGGAGMVLRADVMGAAIDEARARSRVALPLIYLSPRGAPITQERAQKLADGPGATLICGRFEGLDQRVIDHYGVEELSLGDFVLSGGEIAAQALIDAALRLRPGVLGNAVSTEEESFSNGLLEHPQYTRPADWRGLPIPEVLLSGDHGKVAQWRQSQSEALTRERRPDLWKKHEG